MSSAGKILSKLSSMDRRIVHFVILAAVTVPFFIPLGLKTEPTEGSRAFFNEVQSAAVSGRSVIISVDFGPDTEAENGPMLAGVLKHVFKAGGRAVILTFHATGRGIAEKYIDTCLRDREYGKDYAFLGYTPSAQNVMLNLSRSFSLDYRTDARGTELEKLELMREVKNYDDVALIIDIANNAIPRFWIQFAVEESGIPMVAALTGVMAPQFYPYLQAGQTRAILAGMQQAAEYEILLQESGYAESTSTAVAAMDSQSMAHGAIVLFIVLGNIGYLASRRRRKETGEKSA